MQFTVRYYRMADGREPVREFLDRRLTVPVDDEARIFELRVGRVNIARIFWCYGEDRGTIVAL